MMRFFCLGSKTIIDNGLRFLGFKTFPLEIRSQPEAAVYSNSVVVMLNRSFMHVTKETFQDFIFLYGAA